MTDNRDATTPTMRTADAGDIDDVTALADRFYREEGFATSLSQLTANVVALIESPDAHVQLAIAADGTPVAFSVTTTTLGLEHHRVAELQDLYVLPSHRRSGVAQQLITDAATWAHDRDCDVLDVVVDAEGDARHQLVNYYSGRGFIDEHRRLLTRPLRPGDAAS